jgi:transketolase N-terminal domain/subunit
MTATDPARLTIDTIRVLAMDAVQKANAGHPGTAMALAPVAYLLYARDAPRSRHAGLAGAATASSSRRGTPASSSTPRSTCPGYDVTMDDLQHFRQWGSRTPGHPELGHTPGVETTTGPLGQGFANGVGLAIAQRFLADRWNRPHHAIVDSWVYAICSDGDMMEGVTQESASIAGQLGLGRLVYVYDDNHITIDGSTTISYAGEDKGKRFEAYGWHVQHVDDPNDLDALRAAFSAARAEDARPSLIVLRSHIAYPAPNAIDTAKSHGSPLGEDEVRRTKEVLGWDPDETFVVPDAVREHMAGVRERARGSQRLGGAARRVGGGASRTRRRAGARPAGAPARRLAATRSRRSRRRADRDARRGQDRDAGAQAFTPTLIGGAADLVESTKTEFEGGGVFAATHAGRNIAFGIREHGMGSIVNGIALEPAMLKPYGSTFLVFSDYMRPAVRLSALSALRRLGLDARLGRARRGRPDAPARRAPDVAARDAEPLDGAPGGRERDRRRLADRARARRRAGGVRPLPAEAAGARRRGRRRHARGSRCAAGTCCGSAIRAPSPRRSCSRRAPSGHRARGGTVARPQCARRLASVLGAVRGAARRVPRRGAAAVGDGARLDRGGRHVRLGALRRPRRQRASASTASGRRRRPSGSTRSSAHAAAVADAVGRVADAGRLRLRPPRRASARRGLRGDRGAGHEAVDLGVDTDAVRVDYPTSRRSSGRRSAAARRSAACSSAARASAPRSPPARSRASAPRSATTRTPRTRASSTTT